MSRRDQRYRAIVERTRIDRRMHRDYIRAIARVRAPSDSPLDLMDAPLRVTIVDDEPLARAGLSDMLADMPGIVVSGAHASGASLRTALSVERPDVVLLDVEMPAQDGIALARALPGDRRPSVIFVTAHARHAVEAFETDAVDYLLKPVREERLRAALERARRRARIVAHQGGPVEAGSAEATALHQRALPVRLGRRELFVPVADVQWIAGEGCYARLHTATRSYLVRQTLNSLDASLDPSEFVRAHRSAIVSVARVCEVRHGGRGVREAVLENGARVRISPSRWSGVADALRRRSHG